MKNDREYLQAVKLLPSTLRDAALSASDAVMQSAEELRLREGRPLCVAAGEAEFELEPRRAITVKDLQAVLEIATRCSAHSYADSLRQGFVTAEGGLRLGICGIAVAENGAVTGIRRISSECIRIPREKRGIADELFCNLQNKQIMSTIILSPPGGGKTTLLRELVRLISDAGTHVSLVDERFEVAGLSENGAGFDVGSRTDVLSGAPKAEGIMMALRSMSPRFIAFDEITSPSDVDAAILAANCGVGLISTAHAKDEKDLLKRPVYRRLMENGVFQKAVVIRSAAGRRSYEAVDLK